jgi:peptidoglycan-associated lipoprotein
MKVQHAGSKRKETMRRVSPIVVAVLVLLITAAACAKKTPPVARPPAPPATPSGGANTGAPPSPPEPVAEPVVVPSMPEDTVAARSLDELNRDSPLKPVFYELDSTELSPAAQQALQENAQVLRKYGQWQVTIEGHCDERGTPEYNLALGERRALTARDYLVSLGIPVARVKTVSYGKEFPFDPGHDDAAWSKNRRAHFVITAK